MRHQESSAVLSIPEITQTTRHVVGKLQQVKQNVSSWSLKIHTFNLAGRPVRVTIWKYKMAQFLVTMWKVVECAVTTLAKENIIHSLTASRCYLSLIEVPVRATVDLEQLTVKSIILPQVRSNGY